MPETITDRRRAIAERSVESILDGAEGLLEQGKQATISAVAARAGVSRMTVYTHFSTREQLLEAVLERAVRHANEVLEAAEPENGPPVEALERLIAASWREIARHEAISRAASDQLSAEAMSRAHETALKTIRSLI